MAKRDKGRGPFGRFLEFMARRHGPPTSFVRIPFPTRGRLYVSPMPYGPYDVHSRLLSAYLGAQVSAVFTTVTDLELEKKSRRDLLKLYAGANLQVFRLPFKDLTAPVMADLNRMVPTLLAHLSRGHLAVHCNAGVGRTSVVAACLVARAYGCSGPQAIEHIHEHMQLDLTDEQRRFIARFADG